MSIFYDKNFIGVGGHLLHNPPYKKPNHKISTLDAIFTLWMHKNDIYAENWPNKKLLAYSVSLAYLLAAEKFQYVYVYADKYAENFLKLLNLPIHIKSVKSAQMNKNIWVTSKLNSYISHKTPFIHIDNDVYLWDFLQQNFLQKNTIFMERPEKLRPKDPDYDYYNLISLKKAFNKQQVPLPKEVVWYLFEFFENWEAGNAGILGGTNLDIIHKSFNKSLQYANLWSNTEIYENLRQYNLTKPINNLLEQFFFQAFLRYYNQKFNYYLKPGFFVREEAEEKKYTHTFGPAKLNKYIHDGLEKTLTQLYPKQKILIDNLNF